MTAKRWIIIILVIMAVVYAQSSQFRAESSRLIPQLLNYQGYLTDTLNVPIEDTLDMVFKIYDDSSAGNELWNETQTNVTIERGIFSVLLGSVNPVPDSVFTGGNERWLELTIDGNILLPRTRMSSVGYAYTATYSDTADYARNAAADNDWVRGTPDSVLFTANYLGIARGGAGNVLYGTNVHTHTNLGVACTTGMSGQDYTYVTIGGGHSNTASNNSATVGGGYADTASGDGATVGGGIIILPVAFAHL